MTGVEFAALAPIMALAAAPVILLLLIAFVRNHRATAIVTLAGLAVSFALLAESASAGVQQVTPLFIFDGYTLIYLGLIFSASITVTVFSYGYLRDRGGSREEFYVLLLFATLGASVLVASSHFASFFLGLEILSVSLYALIAYPRTAHGNIEAGVKYLVLAAASAAFLLFGMALVYAEFGSMQFARLAALPGALSGASATVAIAGLGLIVVGVGFKLAVVPFHLWTPDVYEGAPAPVAGFVATISKGAMFALLLRLFVLMHLHVNQPLFWVFSIIAVASMIGGNVLALLQNNVKRILAYSSIAHLGYLLVALIASGALAVTAVTFYLIAYFTATLIAFGVIGVLSHGERDADSIDAYRGLFWRRPWLAGAFTGSLLSLAGIPLTAGFIGKFYLIAAGVETGFWVLVFILVVTSVVGLFYYLRIVVALFSTVAPEDVAQLAQATISSAGAAIFAALTILMIWFGTYPTPLIQLIQRTTASLG